MRSATCVSCRPSEADRGRGEVDRGDLPPGGGEPDRLGSVPASRIEGEAWLHVPDLREQESIRRPTRHLLWALAQGLSPAPFPGALVKRLVSHDTTRSGLSNATCCDRAIAPNERRHTSTQPPLSRREDSAQRHRRMPDADVRNRAMRTVHSRSNAARIASVSAVSCPVRKNPSWRPSALTGTVTMLSQLTTLS